MVSNPRKNSNSWIRLDTYHVQAKNEIKKFFLENGDKIFYFTQLKLLFEKKYYHWITYNVLRELYDEGKIQKRQRLRGPNLPIIFYYSSKSQLTETVIKRTIKRKLNVINRSSSDGVNRDVGNHGEHITELFFLRQGFHLEGRNTRSYKTLEWTESDEDLDFIFVKDGIKLGIEVKNQNEYMKKDIFEPKIKIAKYLGIIPLFVVRKLPKSFFFEIFKSGGFVLEFEKKIFPLGYRALVDELISEFQFPVICSNEMPQKVEKDFLLLKRTHLDNKI